MRALRPARIHDEILRRAGAAVVGGEPKHHARDIGRIELLLEALVLEHLPVAVRTEPELDLALRHNPARHDRIDADMVDAPLSRESARHAVHPRL